MSDLYLFDPYTSKPTSIKARYNDCEMDVAGLIDDLSDIRWEFERGDPKEALSLLVQAEKDLRAVQWRLAVLFDFQEEFELQEGES